MYRFTRPHKPAKAFTLVEVLTTVAISSLVIVGSWGIYMMGSLWWHETVPRLDAQRIARMALYETIVGDRDTTAGTDSIGSNSYVRRNGISGACIDMDNDPPTTPVISEDQRRIDFRLEPDSSNVRAFYLGTDSVTGLGVVYYKRDNANPPVQIRPTLGITDLRFGFFVDGEGLTHYNIVRVTATVDRTVTGAAGGDYAVHVEYNDFAYLKNNLI